ncbi:TetR/AcrR family transcriptional regulator [Spongiactinospora sp. TRM90649]|uniref:TetR/AcrR family transcriptional regulator n=1 Tax=Spongiactinospora sp. TRM90649 TaxID=3031114 RepID=UPI0023F8FDD2|nr:TetR/AcrR family transcriptional regulator [Spongiactinospora sp. TRM90649]MDF5752193.1 WHG domain-containing protein [Spongiactinospora sp. TRM90649]
MARAGMTAERLTRAAAELADEIGFDKVTVTVLARHFGVREPSLYAHVGNVRELRLRVAELALTELADRAVAALAGRSGADALTAFACAYRDYARTHPGRYAAGQIRIDADSGAARAARRHSELIRAILRGYGIPEPGQTDAVRFLGGALHGYVSLEAAGGFAHHPRDSEISWHRALDALDVALRRWPSE